MVTQLAHQRWLHLRWCHYYQWKNLLTEEREARRHLEQLHQQQTSQALLQTNGSRVSTVIKEQMVSLAQLRSRLQQKRFILKAVQAQQMDTLRAELTQAGIVSLCDLFQPFSVLRQP